MTDDVFEPIPQRGFGAQDAENCRIEEISNEIRRRCDLYEAESCNGKIDVEPFYIEQRATELFAKDSNLWVPIEDIFKIGRPGPSGNENDTYVSENTVFKVNNLLNCGSVLRLLDKIIMHNKIFPDTYYELYGFTGFEGRSIMPILKQDLVKNSKPALQLTIDTYMAALGFNKGNSTGQYSNGTYEVWDLIPRNVLQDDEGDIFVVDAEIKKL